MNLFLPKSAFTKLFSVLLLLGALTACHGKPAPKVLSSSAQPDMTPSAQPTTTPREQPIFKSDTSGELFDQGQRRTYYLHTPKSYQPNRPLPLVLAFHSYGKQGKDMAASTTLSRLAEQKGFIVVYPDAINKRWDIDTKLRLIVVQSVSPHLPISPSPHRLGLLSLNATRYEDRARMGVDDAAFVSALIAHITKIRTIDRQRIYATGVSNGGILVQRLACQMPEQIAAFASVAASLPVQIEPSCQTQTPISIIMINGTADPTVPWEGGKPPKVRIGSHLSIPPIPSVIDFWRQHNACYSKAQVKQLSGSRVAVSRYPSCRDGSEVVLVELKGGGHIWPGGASGQSQFLDAGQAIWDFFQSHTQAQKIDKH